MGIIDKIKLLFAFRKAEAEIEKEYRMDTTVTKPGWKTTEFWGKVAIQIFTLVGAAKGFLKPETAALITSILEGVYSIARAVVKSKGGSLPDVPAA